VDFSVRRSFDYYTGRVLEAYALGKPRVKVSHYAMVNLIAEEEVVPELVQGRFTAANIVEELGKIIPDGKPRTRMIQQLGAVKAKLKQASGDGAPAEKAAEVILKLVPSAQGRS